MNNNSEIETKKKKYTCHTCHWPIYEGEEVYKSTTGKTIKSGSSTTYHDGVIVGPIFTSAFLLFSWMKSQFQLRIIHRLLFIGAGIVIGLLVGGFLWENFWNYYHDKYSPDFDRYKEREKQKIFLKLLINLC